MDSMVALRTGKGIKFISFNDIIYCKAEGRYTNVYLKNGRSILTARLLKSFENKLPGDLFIRIHKSYIVNLDYISDYKKNINNLILVPNTGLVVSRRKKKGLLKKLDSSFIFV